MSSTVSELFRSQPRVRSALAALAELHRRESADQTAVLPTDFDVLDEVLGGGIRRGEVLLVGGKPGVGKTIVSMQWARAMVQRGAVAVYLCYEHDDVTLLTRLLACELGDMTSAGPARSIHADELLARLRDVAAGAIGISEALASDPLLEEAQQRLASYADRLVFVTGSGTHTNVPAIAEITRRYAGRQVALFVDYVQKVPVYPEAPTEVERIGRVIESLKELALEQQLVVVAIVAADQVGLDARRLHLRHFRGSTALAYEADAIVVLNEKLAVVSRRHVAYAPQRAEEFQRQIVFSIEKNRNGTTDVHLEFEKDFPHYRFHSRGRWVGEHLWTEGSIEQ
jgi:replicative DNA helicase